MDASFSVGQVVDVEKFPRHWYCATIIDISEDGALYVSYPGFKRTNDEWLVAPHDTHPRVEPIPDDEIEARLAEQTQASAPAKTDTVAEIATAGAPHHSISTDLTSVVDLSDVVGCARNVFTETVDKHSAAVILINQFGDPSMAATADSSVEHETSLVFAKRLLIAARTYGVHVVHVTLGCWKPDGTDLEYFKQRAIDDEHEKLNLVPIHPDFDPVRCRSVNEPRIN